jgi:hypothetical protein
MIRTVNTGILLEVVPGPSYALFLPFIVPDDVHVSAIRYRHTPWQAAAYFGYRGHWVASPEDPLLMIQVDTAVPFCEPLDQQALERRHLERFSADFRRGAGSEPYSHWEQLPRGCDPPDFRATANGLTRGVDLTQFGLRERRRARDRFENFRDVVLAADRTRLAHLRGLAIFAWVFREPRTMGLPHGTRGRREALLRALESYRFDPSKGQVPPSGPLPKVAPQVDMHRAGGWQFMAVPILSQPPRSAFYHELGFELGFVFPSTHTRSELWQTLVDQIRDHDTGPTEDLVCTFGAPDTYGLTYPSETEVCDFMLEAIPPLPMPQYIQRVYVHEWETGRIVQVLPETRVVADGANPQWKGES